MIRIESGFVNEVPKYNLETIKRAFSGYTKRSIFYRFVYICDELKELADNITAKKLDINGSKLPEFVLDDELYMLQLTYADEAFIHYKNGRVIDIFDAVGGDQIFEEQFKYEEAQLSGNSVQHNGEVFYEIDTDTRTRLIIARLAYQAKEVMMKSERFKWLNPYLISVLPIARFWMQFKKLNTIFLICLLV